MLLSDAPRFTQHIYSTSKFQTSYDCRAQKRAAWRQARLKSLEQDALQAQIMIQSLNTDADDLSDPKRRPKDALDGVEEEEVSLWAD